MRPSPLSKSELAKELVKITDWQIQDGKLNRVFRFKNFVEAFAFMTASALEAEKLNHHPDWQNVYATVNVSLWTHDAGGITELDFKLAKAMSSLVD